MLHFCFRTVDLFLHQTILIWRAASAHLLNHTTFQDHLSMFFSSPRALGLLSNLLSQKMDVNQAEFLRSKIPMFRRHQPWDSRTDLLIDEIFDEFDERWPLCDKVLPDFDVEKDAPITNWQLWEVRQAYDKFRVVST
jgi:hypothetical protein